MRTVDVDVIKASRPGATELSSNIDILAMAMQAVEQSGVLLRKRHDGAAALPWRCWSKRKRRSLPLCSPPSANCPRTRRSGRAEDGLVMVRGRIGGDGAPFNLGEATVTRAAVRLASGEVGFGYVLGRDREKARLIALCDALLQSDQPSRDDRAAGAGSRSGHAAPVGARSRRSARRRHAWSSSPWCAERIHDRHAERLQPCGARSAGRLPRADGGDRAARSGRAHRRPCRYAPRRSRRALPRSRSRSPTTTRRCGSTPRSPPTSEVAAWLQVPHRRAHRGRPGASGVCIRRRPRARSVVRYVRARHD